MRLCHLMLTSVLAATTLNAWAGRVCKDEAPKTEVFRQAMSAAYANQVELDKLKPQVALIARVGQDLSEYRLKFSHAAFVWRDPAQGGQWRVNHLLNQCGTAKSDLWNEGLGNFFMDDPFSYDAMIIVPPPVMQEKLFAWLSDPAKMQQMRGERYNMLAYPFSSEYQNSNQWVLEGLAVAMSNDLEIKNRQQAQQWLKLMNYQPTELKINTVKRLGGRVFRANIAFDDHPTDRRMSGKIDTITVDSILSFLQLIAKDSRAYVVPAQVVTHLQ